MFYAWIVILNVCVTQGALQIVPNCRDIFLSRVGVSSCSTSTHFPGTYPANLFLLYHDHGFIRATCQTTLQCQKRRDLQHWHVCSCWSWGSVLVDEHVQLLLLWRRRKLAYKDWQMMTPSWSSASHTHESEESEMREWCLSITFCIGIPITFLGRSWCTYLDIIRMVAPRDVDGFFFVSFLCACSISRMQDDISYQDQNG